MDIRLKKLNQLIDTLYKRSVNDFAAAIDRSPSQVSQWRGGHRKIGDAAARHIEMTLKLKQGYMDEREADNFNKIETKGLIPVISYVQAGSFADAEDPYPIGDAEKWIPKYSGSNNVFALRVDGNSMTATSGKSFPEGMLIHVDPDEICCNSGDFIIARKPDNQVTFKQFKTNEGTPYLHPLNPSYDDIYGEFEIIGKVIFAGWDLS